MGICVYPSTQAEFMLRKIDEVPADRAIDRVENSIAI
jgi:hypothetical protein